MSIIKKIKHSIIFLSSIMAILLGLVGCGLTNVTITFDTNGGNLIAPVDFAFGSDIELPNDPIKAGYDFMYWTYKNGDQFVLPQKAKTNLTIYAKWQAGIYPITFDKQGGSGGTVSVTATYGAPMPDATAPSKEGHIFQGYYDTINGGTKYYNADMSSARNWDKASNATLYARWTGDAYTVTLNKQGGSGGTSSVNATYGLPMPSATAPTREGYSFYGYYDAVSGGTKYYNADMSSARNWDKANNATLYARWTGDTYTVTLDKQGGSGGTSSVDATYGESMPSAIAPTSTKEGYVFGGYYDAVSGGTKYYNADMSSARNWDKANNATLYARWTGDTYTVTLDKQGGSGGTSSVDATYGESMPSAIAPTSTKEGYVFGGYYDAVSGGTKYYNADMSSARNWDKASNATLYARWTGDTYTVTLDNQEGSGGTASVTATYGEPMPNATAPTREGYSFYGYYDAVSGGTKYYNADMSSARNWDKASNATLYAHWIFDENYTGTEGLEYSCSASTCSITSYRGASNTVIIPMWHDGKKVTSIEYFAFSYCSSLTSITIPNSVTSIGFYAFQSCYSLTSINVEGGNQYYKSIDGVLFSKDGTTLIAYPAGKTDASYTIPDGVTSIGSSAFEYCSSLTNIIIPSSVTSIGSSAFEYCSSLTSITIPNSVTSIGSYAFSGCNSLTSITIPSSVTSIDYGAFEYCSSLTSITIPNSVTSIGSYAFSGCSGLETVTFENNSNLTSIGDGAFQFCISLTTITIPNSVTSIGSSAFEYCSSLISINVEEGNQYYKSIDGVLFSKDGTTLIAYPAGKTDASYTIPDGVTSIGSSAFAFCSSLTSITIPSSVTSIGSYAFYGRSGLETVTFENNSNLTSIGSSAFYECSSLTSITIPSSVTSIGSYAFYHCSSLTSIDVEGGNQYYKSIDGVLFSKDGTTLIAYPAGKTDASYTIPDGVTSIGDGAFWYCLSLTSIIIPSSVTSIGSSAFENCSSLTNIIIPSSVTSIGSYAFYGWTSSQTIYIQGRTSAPETWDYWNYNCSANIVFLG